MLDIALCYSLRDRIVPMTDGEMSFTETCPICSGIGQVVSYVEYETGAVIEMPCPGCDEMGIVEGITYCLGETDCAQELADLADFEIMHGNY